MQPRSSNRRDICHCHSCGRILTNLAEVIGGLMLFVTIVFLSVFPLKICSQKTLMSVQIVWRCVHYIVIWSLSSLIICLTMSTPLSFLKLLQLMPSFPYDNLYDFTHWWSHVLTPSLLPCVWMAVISKGMPKSTWIHWLPSIFRAAHAPLSP